jgi:glutamate-ammonia-ligase adenylyltransferase
VVLAVSYAVQRSASVLSSSGAKAVAETEIQANTAEFQGIKFRNPEAAARNLGCASRELRAPLLHLLQESPDPDAALNFFERLIAAAGHELLRLFERHPFLLHYAIVVFGYSQYLGETLVQNPDLFQALLREKNLERTHSREEFAEAFARFRSRSVDTEISLLLARFKRREYVRIMLRDVLRLATLAEATAEISALTDTLLEEALREADMRLRNQLGPPQTLDRDGRLALVPFAVFSLGKLGGNELNYSSDIDLLFVHGDGEAPAGAAISNREYFIRLAQLLTESLSRVTREGAPFRIDLRLRPQGSEGELAIAFSRALDYYAHQAGDWERQALIKLRHSAGNQALARAFIRQVQPFVYTEAVNFEAIETALNARERIRSHRRKAMARPQAKGIDVKLDRGGIRDIEFLVQCLQRVYGGAEHWLRSCGTLFSLQKLHDKGHLSGKDFQELTTAYEFLRNVEHRLQLRQGQQTHTLPAATPDLELLARMVIPAATAHTTAAAGQPLRLAELVQRRMAAVAEIYTRIVHQQQFHQQHEDSDLYRGSMEGTAGPGNQQVLNRLVVEAPILYDWVQRADLQLHARRNLYRFLSSAFASGDQGLVASAPGTIKQAMEVFGLSDYLTELLIRYPEEIATLEMFAAQEGKKDSALEPKDTGVAVNSPPAPAAPFGLREGGAPLAFAEHGVPRKPEFGLLGWEHASYTERLADLRLYYRKCLLASGVQDVIRGRSIWEALAETTAAADVAIQAAFSLTEAPGGFAVFALGRLGTGEHDLLSDADLLFVRDEAVDPAHARRAAERMVEALSSYTREGAVFPVDARLRPHGGEGELVVTPLQLEAYFTQEAVAWEALMFTKLRCLAGESALAARVREAVGRLLSRFAADEGFMANMREMRSRLEKLSPEIDDVKTSPGGLYDIDFIIGSRLVLHGMGDAAGTQFQRLGQLHERGLLDRGDCHRLQRHLELLRTAEHAMRLVTGNSRKTLPVSGPARAACEELCTRMLKREFPESLEISLRFALVGVRGIYNRLVGAG